MLDVRHSLKVDTDELIAHMLAAGAMTEADLTELEALQVRFFLFLGVLSKGRKERNQDAGRGWVLG